MTLLIRLNYILFAGIFFSATFTFANNSSDHCHSALLGISAQDASHNESLGRQEGLLARMNKIFAKRAAPVTSATLDAAKEAIAPFKAFESSLNSSHLESDYAIRAILTGIIAGQNTLLIGKAGNGKTMVVDSIFGNITIPESMRKNFSTQIKATKRDLNKSKAEQASGDYTSYFSKQLHAETTLAQIFGDIDYGKFYATGERRYRLDLGASEFVFVFFDEIFDAPLDILRAFNKFLNERVFEEGDITHSAATLSVVSASNYYIDDVYEMARRRGINVEAVMDRFGSVVVMPKKFANNPKFHKAANDDEKLGSMALMMKNHHQKTNAQIQPISLDKILALKKLHDEVTIDDLVFRFLKYLFEKIDSKLSNIQLSEELAYQEELGKGREPNFIPYKSTKLFTKRWHNKAVDKLKALVVMDWIAKDGNRPLAADFKDIIALKVATGLIGPADKELEVLISQASSDPRELNLLKTVMTESNAFRDAWIETIAEFEAQITRSLEP